ncbi:hypothetical protein BC830DRAFT_1148102 [Chytriomyces sp. MP71]|nr:hypothetical protein BC830DRAFT_1148102 [Chytriomyces sp. MP71]
MASLPTLSGGRIHMPAVSHTPRLNRQPAGWRRLVSATLDFPKSQALSFFSSRLFQLILKISHHYAWT